jgi:hypothetical protein
MPSETKDSTEPEAASAASPGTLLSQSPFALAPSLTGASWSSMFPPLMLASSDSGATSMPMVLIPAPMFTYPHAGTEAGSTTASVTCACSGFRVGYILSIHLAAFPYPPPGGTLTVAALDAKPKRKQVKRAVRLSLSILYLQGEVEVICSARTVL